MAYALITGASKGIGKCLAEGLAARGYDVLLVARSEQLLLDLGSSLQSRFKVNTAILAIDLSAPGAADKVFAWARSYDIRVLVNNAGYGLGGALDKSPLSDTLAMMRVNMEVPVSLCRLLLPQLRQQPKAYILNIASSAAYQSVPGMNVYAATKSFVLSFSRGLRQELKKSAVSVTCVSPGATDTNFVNQAQLGEKARKMADKVNMSPEKVAAIALRSLFAGKGEVIPGFINKLGAAAAWLLPKGLTESTAMKIYQP
jgi:short-subunit dehydrogenase